MKPLVIYHKDCFDGFTAAWVFRWAHGDLDVEWLPARYGDAAPKVSGRRVTVVDFSYPREEMFRLADEAETLTVLDHHKTAQAALEGLEKLAEVVFDMERSGAGIAWDHFMADKRPWLVDYVEDRDLWRQSLPQTDSVSAWVASQPMTFEAWDAMYRDGFAAAVQNGEAVKAYIHQYGTKALAQARWEHVAGHKVPTVNMPYMNCSEHVGRLLRETGAPFAVGYFRRDDGKWQFSLRSGPTFDVSEVAKKYGGGGHAGAAGFEAERLPWES